MEIYIKRAAKVQQRIDEIASFSNNGHYLSRVFGTKPYIECAKRIASWMEDAGLEIHIDNIGNIRGKLCSSNPEAKTFVIASHFDTTFNAGKYDGVLGIIMGLDIIENLCANNISLPFHFEVIAFSEEEGIRFPTGYLGSKVVSGTFKNKLLELKDDRGTTLSQVLQLLNFDRDRLKEDAILPEDWLAYFEIHIEQGAVLYEKNLPVGIVSSIIGHKRINITFTGETGHAGTVPMNMRKDALCAAAKFILGVEKYASKEKRNIVATIGKISIPDSAPNVIPGTVNCTLDMRSNNSQSLSDGYEFINELCEKICDKRNIYFEWKLVQETEPVTCSKKFRKLLSNAFIEKNFEVINLESSVVHDAAIIAQVAPVCMLFVKCLKGNGRNPLESVEDYDIATALDISDYFIQQLISLPEKGEKKK
ncbi:MAG TPA: M20 family metallo-hydrolase [Hanamia sp.]|nr:M20 family metallo-hydrolase [Hanamia sp.]